MTYDREQLLKTLENLPIYANCNFGEENQDEVLAALNNKMFYDYDYAYGATKLAIIPVDKDYVIKIPYTGTYNRNYYNEDDEYDETLDTGEWVDFCGAEDADECWNYCSSEVNRYKIAEEYGFAICFAETRLLGDVHNFPIYVQEKCEILEHCHQTHTHSREECNLYSLTYGCSINPNWLIDFSNYYGKEMLNSFLKFLTDMGWDDDLRSSNIGYIKDRPVIVDYSGYWE